MKIFSLEGRVALVTGASRGLGRAMAQALAEAGATVVLAARDSGKLDEVAREIRAAGHRADIEAFDLTDEKAVIAAVPSIVRRHGRLDILLNNAGVCLWGGLMESSLDVWRMTMEVNLTATYLLARERLQAYVASKHGVAGLTKSLAGELGRHGITCNAIAPGFFLTDMAEAITSDPARQQIFTNAIAAGRWGRPEELAGAAIFLASDAASYVNGHMLHVDGGVAEVLSLPVAVSS